MDLLLGSDAATPAVYLDSGLAQLEADLLRSKMANSFKQESKNEHGCPPVKVKMAGIDSIWLDYLTADAPWPLQPRAHKIHGMQVPCGRRFCLPSCVLTLREQE